MRSASGLAVALCMAYGAGLNLYATLGITGLGARLGWIGPLPSSMEWLASSWVIAVAGVLFVIEFVACQMPGVSSAWDTFHSLVRPPAAALLAATVVWRDDPHVILAAALVGGLLAVVIHTANLGVRYAIESSAGGRTGLAVGLAELGVVTAVTLLAWHYPLPTLGIALGVLLGFVLVARVVLHSLRQVFAGHWMPRRGLLQEPRTLVSAPGDEDEDEP